jgi:hypothetical protein
LAGYRLSASLVDENGEAVTGATVTFSVITEAGERLGPAYGLTDEDGGLAHDEEAPAYDPETASTVIVTDTDQLCAAFPLVAFALASSGQLAPPPFDFESLPRPVQVEFRVEQGGNTVEFTVEVPEDEQQWCEDSNSLCWMRLGEVTVPRVASQ